jgi:hypothetical protein
VVYRFGSCNYVPGSKGLHTIRRSFDERKKI